MLDSLLQTFFINPKLCGRNVQFMKLDYSCNKTRLHMYNYVTKRRKCVRQGPAMSYNSYMNPARQTHHHRSKLELDIWTINCQTVSSNCQSICEHSLMKHQKPCW